MKSLFVLQKICREVLEDDSLTLTLDQRLSQIRGWDSVAMVQFVLAVEAEFSVRFTTDEVAGFRAVSDIVLAIDKHRGQQ